MFDNDNCDEELSEEELFYISSRKAAHLSITGLLRNLIQKFPSFGFTTEDLIKVAKLYALVCNPENYIIDGYINFTVIDNKREGEVKYRFCEILYDNDGLRLIIGGYLESQYGGDSFSNILYPKEFIDSPAINELLEYFSKDFMKIIATDNATIDITENLNRFSEIDL